MVCGPLIELELQSKSDVVPEGLRISVAHFLSAPDDEIFRNALEGDNHQHHLVKIFQDAEDGERKVKVLDSFTRVGDSFCFETESLAGERLCHLVITTGLSGEEEEKPVCHHGVSTTTAVIQTEGKCPNEDGALQCYVLCKSRVQAFRVENEGNIKVLDSKTIFYHSLEKTSDYMLIITPGAGRCVFNFRNLCKSNGTHYLGNFPNKIEAKNCKSTSKVHLELKERVPHPDLWDQKTLLIRDIEACQHEDECKFVELEKQKMKSYLVLMLAVIVGLLAILFPFLTIRGSGSGDLTVSFSDHYQAGLSKLWGETTLAQLQEHVRRGDLNEQNIRAMATRMDVLRVYQENVNKNDLVETFELMLEKWFNEELFETSSSEAQAKLVSILSDSRSPKKVVAHIKKLCDSI